MRLDEDLRTLEAALYVAGRPLTIEELSNIIDKAESTTEKLLRDLEFEYVNREGALEIVELPRERFVLQLKPELTPRVSKYIPGGLLSYSTLQTLVYIALKQPILQSDLVVQRGTHCYDHVKDLIFCFIRWTASGSVLLKHTRCVDLPCKRSEPCFNAPVLRRNVC